MQDSKGRELKIGDVCVWSHVVRSTARALVVRVKDFTPKMVCVAYYYGETSENVTNTKVSPYNLLILSPENLRVPE